MTKGKQTCKILKEIRRQIALANNIDLVISECHFKGDCRGTCPRCEAEVRYLEQQLERRRMAGKAASVIGVSMSITSLLAAGGMTSCQSTPSSAGTEQFVSMETITTTGIVLSEEVTTEIPATADSTTALSTKQEVNEPSNAEKIQEIITIETTGDILSGIVDSDDSIPTTDTDLSDTYLFVDEMPEFPGGPGVNDYVRNQARYPEAAKEKGIEGRVVVSFIVKADGTTDDLQILKGLDPILDAEALRIINSVPRWTPGRLQGKEVNVRITIPVDFTLP